MFSCILRKSGIGMKMQVFPFILNEAIPFFAAAVSASAGAQEMQKDAMTQVETCSAHVTLQLSVMSSNDLTVHTYTVHYNWSRCMTAAA